MPSQHDPAASHDDATYPNDFSRSHLAAQLAQQHASADSAELDQRQPRAVIAGRLMLKAASGTASTGLLQDTSGRFAIVVSDEATGKAAHAAFANWQLGDIVGVGGILCRLPSGELALRAHELRRLVRAVRPLPSAPSEAGSGRYADLLTGERALRMARLRYRLMQGVREFLARRMYMEVETPILHETPPAAIRQFRTHHNALDRALYLRQSAARHLQKLLIGGIEQVFEINRNFSNGEAASPCEETAVEIYCAYTNDSYMMALLEALLTSTQFLRAPFARITVADAIRQFTGKDASDAELRDPAAQRKVLYTIAAPRLTAPTFVVGFPADVSPGARRRSAEPQLAEYFELFVSGTRIAEGCSVQNDPELASHDRDFQRALEYGLPPAAGVRLSIDSLVQVVAGVSAVADTHLFRALDES